MQEFFGLCRRRSRGFAGVLLGERDGDFGSGFECGDSWIGDCDFGFDVSLGGD
jgi:hypothetical protein